MRISDWSSGVGSSDHADPPPSVAPVTQNRQAALETVIQQRAAAESVNVLGQQVLFSNPSGYCTPGKSAREVELMDLAKRSLAEGSRLVHAAVRCSELEDYRAGRREQIGRASCRERVCQYV